MAQVKVDPATHGPPSASAKHHQQLQFRVGPAVTQSALVAADLAPIWPAQALHQWQQRWPWAPFLYAGPTLQRLIRAPEHEHHGGSSSAVTRSRLAPQLWRGWHWRSIAALELADATLSVISPRLAAATMAPDWETALARVREIQARFPGAANAANQPRDPQELQEELDLFARLRSQFRGPPLTSAEIIAAIDRDSHPPEPPGLAAAGKVSH